MRGTFFGPGGPACRTTGPEDSGDPDVEQGTSLQRMSASRKPTVGPAHPSTATTVRILRDVRHGKHQ
jgi:hypothetical protein